MFLLMWYVGSSFSFFPSLFCFRRASKQALRSKSVSVYLSTHPSINLSTSYVLIAKKTQGTNDNFYHQGQLLPENFIAAAQGKGHVNVRWQDGYDHSYFTMATFADDHVAHAAKYLLA